MSQKKFAIVLVEGETEKSLIQDFKSILKYPIKKVVKVNLWNNKIKSLLPSITEPSEIVVVFDTDLLVNINRFKENIELLKAKKHAVLLFQQNNDFECELSSACAITKNKLFEEFCPKIPSSDNFKNEFIKTTNRLKRLDDLKINKDKLWEKKLIKQLVQYQAEHSSHKKYFS